VPADSVHLPAAPHVFEPGLFGRLPCRLDELSPSARARTGRALDDGRIRYLLDRDGRVLVVRSARA
jgi:hypothetical protein